jgi:hypothetical protein
MSSLEPIADSSQTLRRVLKLAETDAAPLAFGSQLLFSGALPPRQSPPEAPQLFTGSNRIFNPGNIQQSDTKQIVGEPQDGSRKTHQGARSIKP